MKLSLFRLRILVLVGWIVLVGSVYFVKDHRVGSVLSASSPWAQTDWSGGTASGTVNSTVTTYESESSIDTATSGQFSLDTASGWYNASWSYRRKITFDNTTANLGVTSEALTDFPVLVKLTSSNIDYSNTKDAGEDIRFTDSDGTTALSYEIEKWDESGTSYIWVKVPSIDINSNTDYIYAYYGNPGASDGQSANSVWDSNYLGVWHNSDSSSTTVQDSTGNNKDGTKQSSNQPNYTANGQIAGAQTFTQGQSRISTSINDTLNDFSVEIWFKDDGTTTQYERLADKSYINCFWFGRNSNSSNSWGGGVMEASDPFGVFVTLTDGQWHRISSVRSGTTHYVYGDGGTVNSNTVSGTACNTTNFGIGGWGDGSSSGQWFGGTIDEVRISNVARSAAWISASYHSETDDFNTFGSAESKYTSSGTLTSNIFDSGVAMDWGLLTYSSSGSGTTAVKVRTGNNSNLSDATSWGSCTAITSGTDISTNNCVNDGDRYIQYLVTLQSSGASTPIFEDINIAFVPSDSVPPDVNASLFEISGLAQSGDWYKDEATITWSEGSDDDDGNGLLGYCISLDEADQGSSHGLNPQNVAGVLTGKDDGVSQNYCPFIVRGNSFDISTIPSLNLVSGKEYFFSIKAVDLAGNIYTGIDETWKDVISFRYDNTPPTAPFYISLPANFLSSKDVVITWPVGVGGADDLDSGVAGLQYRIGESGIWYGDLHTGTQDINDLLVNDGSYVTDETYDYPVLLEGNNLVYFRAIDNVGNTTSSENYVKGVIKLNTVAPSPVRNLSVSPTNSETNAYSFEWDLPVTYTGSSSGMTYCYAINTIPSESTCTFTQAGVTQLSADAFATQPGTNTMYIVARDEAGNINYATYSEPGASVSFTYSGTAPGIPQNLDVADISVKSTANWRLVLSWDKPTNVGAGISYYNIYRSITNTSCSGGLSGFSKIGSSTSTSYIDPDLEQKNYYYCIKACDSANNCSASSGTIGKLPTGKYTTPAELLSAPEVVSFTTRKAVISWVTDRVSDSSIEYGTKSGEYFTEEVSNSTQLANHTISLNNLQPGTTYYYRAKWTDIDGNTGVSEEKTFATLPPPQVVEVKTSDIRTNSAQIIFTVKSATSVDILYGQSTSYGGVESILTSSSESQYIIRLNNLVEDSMYNYKFILQDVEGNDYDSIENHRFTTLPFPSIQNIQIEEVKNTAQPTVNILWSSNIPVSTILKYYPLDNPEQKRDQIDLELKIDHNMEIVGLNANTKYGLIVSGRDALGNEAVSDEYQFTTDEDSRPPVISNIKVETRMSTDGASLNQAQLIVSWDTDEAATSQVEYGEGSTGEYTQKTLVDDNASFNHLIIINNLRPSSVYHLRVLSKDSVGNEAVGRNIVTISAQLSENPLDIIISRLTEAFGFIR